MPTYACHNNDFFVLTIDAPTKQDAENATGLSAVEAIDGKPWAGWIIEDLIFKSARPFQSWIWDGSNWNAPESKPNDSGTAYYWNEQELQWLVVEQDRPYPSWVVGENSDWQAPVAMPTEGGPWMWNEEAGNWEEIPMLPAE